MTPLSGDAQPHPKEAATRPGRVKRYRRKIAGPKQWQALVAEKAGPCRICHWGWATGYGALEMHHLVSRAQRGDDVADNLIPLCAVHHLAVTTGDSAALQRVALTLTDAERAYIVGKLGEGGMERLFGVTR